MDVNPEVIGTSVGNLKVQPMSALSDAVAREQIDIGVIAVPAAEAQAVADALIATGISALLNLALVQLRVPETVQVVEERIVVSLQELAYGLCTTDGEREVRAT
jgi:redox-sensing transcriptional repressor